MSKYLIDALKRALLDEMGVAPEKDMTRASEITGFPEDWLRKFFDNPSTLTYGSLEQITAKLILKDLEGNEMDYLEARKWITSRSF